LDQPTIRYNFLLERYMAEAKTKLNDASVSDFLNKIPDEQLRADCYAIVDIMQSAVKAEPRMWGSAIIGFGECMIQYAGGREAAWMMIGFSPRKQNITLYIGSSFPEHDELLANLGTHSCGKGCLYIKRLSDVALPTLKKLISASVKHKLKPSVAATSSKVKSVSKSSSLAKSKARSPKSRSKAKTPVKSKSKSSSKSRGK
jgi:hypothetical protein